LVDLGGGANHDAVLQFTPLTDGRVDGGDGSSLCVGAGPSGAGSLRTDVEGSSGEGSSGEGPSSENREWHLDAAQDSLGRS
jgi:hypothetical protein